MSSRIEDRLAAAGHQLPSPPAAVGNYVPVTQIGNLVVTSGQLPFVGKELAFTGKVGKELGAEEGANAARICVVNALAQVKACIGALEQVKRVVRMEGFVQAAPGFKDHAQVLNGASTLLVHTFGEEKGRHTRTAIGVNEMPLNAAVQLTLWVEV